MSLLDAIIHDLKRLWLAFEMKWLESELEYVGREIEKQKKIIAECDVKIAAKKDRAR